MRRLSGIICLLFLIVLTACSPKTERDVLQELTERKNELKSYQSHGKLTVHNDQDPTVYDVEVWYKKPDLYRVEVKNVKKDITQILLRNKEGVFVLTPQLKKSFRFQSNWPKSNGQIYLYQTVLNSIINDKGRKYQKNKNQYQFDVKSNSSQNSILPKQRIWLDDNLHPKKVSMLDQKNQEMITVTFDRFKENSSFDSDAFERARNMNQVTDTKTTTVMASPHKEAVAPAYVPTGSRFQVEHRLKSINGQTTIMRYGGKRPFSLTVSEADEKVTESSYKGKPVYLENTVGVLLTNGKQRHLTWTSEGMEYKLVGSLPEKEMIKIANTTFEPEGK